MEFIKLFLCGALGLSGYILSGLYDVSIIHEKKLLRKIAFPGFFITAVPYVLFFFMVEIPHHIAVTVPVILLIFVFSWLLIYSVLIEIPRNNGGNSVLYDRGTYSFSRHPGFLWYTTINVLVAILFWDPGILLLCTLFTIFNFVLVIMEDRVLFPRMFSSYQEYRDTVPFLFGFPKIRSGEVDSE